MDFKTVFVSSQRTLQETYICMKPRGLTIGCVQAGISRSATTVISYLMSKENLSFEDAIAEVMQIRQTISPNRGFCRQLKILQEDCEGQLANYQPEMLQASLTSPHCLWQTSTKLFPTYKSHIEVQQVHILAHLNLTLLLLKRLNCFAEKKYVRYYWMVHVQFRATSHQDALNVCPLQKAMKGFMTSSP